MDVTTGLQDTVAAIWRKVFPGNVRDMVFGLPRNGGQAFVPPALIYADHWHINACPHRGGMVGVDGSGRLDERP